MTEQELDIWASRTFLTEPLSSTYEEMSEDELDDFLHNHAIEPIEEYHTMHIREYISNLAERGRQLLEQAKL